MTDPYAAVPAELKALPQWVLWRPEKRGDKITKMPYNPSTLAHASSADPNTWSSFDAALHIMNQRNRRAPRSAPWGLGFVFSPDDPYCGIDLDKCYDENDTLTDFAWNVLDAFNRHGSLSCYAETSPSGKGLHIICRARWPGEKGMNNNQLGIEAYDRRRYFTITGNALTYAISNENSILDDQDAIDEIYRTYAHQEAALPIKAEHRALEPGAPRTWKGINLVVNSDAEPPSQKFRELWENPTFRNAWAHKQDTKTWGRESGERSPSNYDMSIGRFAERAGWSDQEICNLLITHRRENGLDKTSRLDYYQRTIFALRETSRRQQALADLDNADTLDANDKPLIKNLIQTLIGLRIERYTQCGRSPASYAVLLANGESAVLPTSRAARSQDAWQDIAQEHTGEPFPTLKATQWQKFLKCLAALREYEEMPDASHREALRGLLAVYATQATSFAVGEKPNADLVRTGEPLVHEPDDGTLYVNLDRLRAYIIAMRTGVALDGLQATLHTLGAQRTRFQVVDAQSGALVKRRYWRLSLDAAG